MDKIKSRWLKTYLEGDNNNGTLTTNNLNSHHNHHLNNHNSNISNNHHSSNNTTNNHNHNDHNHHHNYSKHSQPPQYEQLDENLYLDRRKNEHSRSRKDARSMVCDCILTKEERARGVMGCSDDCLNRMLMIECGSRCTLGDHCLNKRFQKCQSAKVEVFKTRKKGWGLRTCTDLPANSFIMEYVGEVVRAKEFKSRVKKYTKQKIKHHYFMALQSDEIIDATVKGNATRFINHSCEPNCETQKWTVNGELRIGFFTLRNLRAGEEITFDYQFQRYGRKAQKCYCEAPSCRGYIGGNDQTFSLNGSTSPQSQSLNPTEPGFKIPKLTRLQRMEIEKRMEEEVKNNDSSSNDKPATELQKTPFATRNYFKLATTNGLVNKDSTTKTDSLPVKRRFDSTTTNNIDLTPAPKISREEHRKQFEMYARLKDYYDAIVKIYESTTAAYLTVNGPTLNEPSLNGPSLNGPSLNEPSLNGPSLNGPSLNGPSLNGPSLNGPSLNGPSLNGPPPPYSHVAGQNYPLAPAISPQVLVNQQALPSQTLILLANQSTDSATVDDELAFSLCDYDEYYSNRDRSLSIEDVKDKSFPYPGSYYTTPSGENWFATVTLDRKTQQPRSVILNLQTRSETNHVSNTKKMFERGVSKFIKDALNEYYKPTCQVARITSKEDFVFLARKLTLAVLEKEQSRKGCERLECNKQVQRKVEDFVRAYMAKFGKLYTRHNKA